MGYGIRAKINGKGEFMMETLRLDGSPQRVKSKIDLRNVRDSMIDAANMEKQNSALARTYQEFKCISSNGFKLPRSTSSVAMHLQAFSFELIDYGAMYPVEF